MGRLSQSLRTYEEEIGDLEARLTEAEKARNAITASFASIEIAREHLMEQTRMESAEMIKQAQETLARARRQAQELLEGAKAEIERLFEALAADTQEVVDAAERDAAAARAEAEAASEKMLATATADAEKMRVEAQAEAAAHRHAARSQAAAEAASILSDARAEHDRLAGRIPELRNALTQFEAQVHALAAGEAIDLNAVEAEERVATEPVDAAEEVQEVAAGGDVAEDHAVAEVAPEADGAIPAPDGSGTLPEAREPIDLTQYRTMREAPGTSSPEPEPDEAVAAAATQPVAPHVARRTPNVESDTIYQRRGGGIRRRIRAQGDTD
jgi:cell division septum initiation protein DivIVA